MLNWEFRSLGKSVPFFHLLPSLSSRLLRRIAHKQRKVLQQFWPPLLQPSKTGKHVSKTLKNSRFIRKFQFSSEIDFQ